MTAGVVALLYFVFGYMFGRWIGFSPIEPKELRYIIYTMLFWPILVLLFISILVPLFIFWTVDDFIHRIRK